MHWRRKWQPTPVFLPGESQGRESLVGCRLWGRTESDTTGATSLSFFTFMHWRRKWQPTPVFLHGESQGWGSLVGCHLWGAVHVSVRHPGNEPAGRAAQRRERRSTAGDAAPRLGG